MVVRAAERKNRRAVERTSASLATVLLLYCSAALLIQPAHLIAQLLPVVVEECIRNRLQVPGDNLIKIVHRKPDAVIGEAVLRKVIGTNSFASIARADEALPLRRPF